MKTKTVSLQVSSRGPYARHLEIQGYTQCRRPGKDGGRVVATKLEAAQHTGRKTVTGRNPD